MAVVSIDEIHDGRDGETSSAKGRAARRYTRVWMVTTNNRFDEAAVVNAAMAAAGHAIGAVYPYDSGARLVKRIPRGDTKSKFLWWVTGTYETSTLAENPLNDAIEIQWKTKPFRRPYTQDRFGDAILNSAGDPYDPPWEGDDDIWEVSVRRNLAAVPSWIIAYRRSVNSDAITLDGIAVDPGYAKLTSISIGKWEERNGTAFRVVEFLIQVRDDAPWVASILDAGTRELSAFDENERLPITDKGRRVTAPVPLNGSGFKLDNPTPSTAVYRTHEVYIPKAYSVLLT